MSGAGPGCRRLAAAWYFVWARAARGRAGLPPPGRRLVVCIYLVYFVYIVYNMHYSYLFNSIDNRLPVAINVIIRVCESPLRGLSKPLYIIDVMKITAKHLQYYRPFCGYRMMATCA